MGSAHRAVWHWWVAGAAFTALIVLLAMALEAVSWREAYVSDGRLLPGTVVAGVDVGGQPEDEAGEAVRAAADERLARPVTIVLGDSEHQVTPGDLGATTDAEQVAAAAVDASTSASLRATFGMHWFGTPAFEQDLRVEVPEAQIVALVDRLAEGYDREPQPARIEWAGGDVRLEEHEDGRRVDPDAAVEEILRTFDGTEGHVALTTEENPPQITTAMVESVFPAVRSAVDEALDRTVTVRHDDTEWRVIPRELGATPKVGPFVEATLAEAHGEVAQAGEFVATAGSTDLSLSVPDRGIEAFLDEVADEVEREARDAAIDYSSGRIELEPERVGQALDRTTAARELRDAFDGQADTVEVPLEEVAPEVASEDLEQVLLVRLDERMLYLYTEGEVSHEWPVAVGAGGSATPTGEFEVGDMRNGPTWYNPAPDGWGAGMPSVIGPGPDNPLGLRALNWNRDGHDTLIRFHGTPDTGSIGQAASRGCVRMFNEDVIELFDLMESGAPIVSLNG